MPATGSQSLSARNPAPKVRNAGQPPTNRVTMMAPSSTSTTTPATPHSGGEHRIAGAAGTGAPGCHRHRGVLELPVSRRGRYL